MTINAIAYTVMLLQTLAPTLENRIERAAVREALRRLKVEFPEAFEDGR